MIAFIAEYYDWFSVPLAFGFFQVSEWFMANIRLIYRTQPETPRIFLALLSFTGAVSAYFCAFRLLEGGSDRVLSSCVSMYLGYALGKYLDTPDTNS